MVVISDTQFSSLLNQVRAEIFEDSSYNLTTLSNAVDLCVEYDAPVCAAMYRECMKDRIAQLMSEETE